MTLIIKKLMVPLVAVGLCACVAAGEDDLGSGQNPIDDDAIAGCGVTTIFATSCAGANCHDADAPAKGLDLATSSVGTRVRTMTSSCNGLPVVEPGDAAGSYLMAKVMGTAECGEQMPKGGTPLDATSLNCIASWIDALPPRTGGGGGTPGGGGGGGGTPGGGGGGGVGW